LFLPQLYCFILPSELRKKSVNVLGCWSLKLEIMIKVILLLLSSASVHSQNLIAFCSFTVYESSTVGGGDGPSAGTWRISEIPFRLCDGTELVTSNFKLVNSINCNNDTFTDISNLIDGDRTTDYRCSPIDTSISTGVQLDFEPLVYLGGYDIISKSSGDSENGFPIRFDMKCFDSTSTQVLIDNAYTNNIFQPVIDTPESQKKYTNYSTDDHPFLGAFDNDCSNSGDNSLPGVRDVELSSSAGGDPFVHLSDGEIIQFWLPVGKWTEVLASPQLKVLCRSFPRIGTTEQWLDGLRIIDVATGAELLHVEIPSDIPLGSAATGPDSDLSFLRILIDGHQVEHTSRDQLSSMNNLVSVHVGKLTKTIMGLPGDALWVHTPDFGFSIFTSSASKFDSSADNDAFAHINFKFTDLPRDAGLTGFFAETILGNTMSGATKNIILRPQLRSL